MQVFILSLTYSINFHDVEEGDCHAGNSCRIISIHQSRAVPEAIAAEFNPLFPLAEKEHIICPIQPLNRSIKQRFGFTLHDIDDGYDFHLSVNAFDVEP